MNVGVVVIGRNEGDRLRQCLESVKSADRVVYVDSGSTDGSVELARSLGADVVELDVTIPFTAARARNTGWQRLDLCDAIQFVDGDCEVREGWLNTAIQFLKDHPGVVAVCGRRRERHPDASIFNYLCDLEWSTPIGPALSCGGDVLMRRTALAAVGGYRDELIAGEEPELCTRLRAGGGTINRLDAEMTWHDAAMTRFGQWWRRAVRAGHAYAEVTHMTGLWQREVRSTWFWAALVPLVAIIATILRPTFGPLVLLMYGVLFVRIASKYPLSYAAFCVIAKFAHLRGMLGFWWNRLLRRRSKLIEYKSAPVVPT